MDANGNGWAVWVQNDGTRNAIWVNRYTANTTSWGTPSVIDPGMNGSGDPQIGIDGSGNALVVWYQAYGPLNRQHTVSMANRYTAPAGDFPGWLRKSPFTIPNPACLVHGAATADPTTEWPGSQPARRDGGHRH